MKQRLGLAGVAVVAVVCFVLGIVAQRVYDARRTRPGRQSQTVRPQPDSRASRGRNTGVNVAADQIRARAAVGVRLRRRRPSPATRRSRRAPPTRNLRPNEDPGRADAGRGASTGSTRDVLARGRPRRSERDRLVSRRPSADARRRRARSRATGRRRRAAAARVTCRTGRDARKTRRPAALPVAYFIRQIQDFRNGLRHTADPRKPNTNTMIDLAKAMTDEEMKAAAEYFAAIKWTPWIRVVETEHGAEDADRRQSVPRRRADEDRADRRAHHRGAGERGAGRDAIAIRTRDSSRTCRSAASRRARISSRPAA